MAFGQVRQTPYTEKPTTSGLSASRREAMVASLAALAACSAPRCTFSALYSVLFAGHTVFWWAGQQQRATLKPL
jgi:hypothetical protein